MKMLVIIILGLLLFLGCSVRDDNNFKPRPVEEKDLLLYDKLIIEEKTERCVTSGEDYGRFNSNGENIHRYRDF